MSVYVLYMTVHVHIYSFAAMYTACVEVHMKVHMHMPVHLPNPIITCSDQLVGVYIASCVCLHNLYIYLYI